MAVARAYGVKKIIAFDIEQSRVDFAVNYNADIGVICPLNKEPVEPMIFATDFMNKVIEEHELGSGVDLTIEATGAETCVQMAVVLTKSGGACEFWKLSEPKFKMSDFPSYSSWPWEAAYFGAIISLHGERIDYERFKIFREEGQENVMLTHERDCSIYSWVLCRCH